MPWLPLPPNAVGLAPMAGISDSPFRQLCKEYGADFVFSEMISATALCRSDKPGRSDPGKNNLATGSKSLGYAKFLERERPVILQIFGHHPEEMAAAAKILVTQNRPDGIDINMGCPVRKVVNGGSGVALMDHPDLAAEITRAVKSAIGFVPLSVKIRLGNTRPCLPDFAEKLEKAGADLLIIHPRLRHQFFKGRLDYEAVQFTARRLSIPVMFSGGITAATNIGLLSAGTGARFFMIGQAALGNPFIFRQIKNPTYRPTRQEILATMLRHAELQIAYRGQETGAITEMRKHFAWYLRGFKNAARWRQQLVRTQRLSEVKKILLEIDR